MAESTQLSGMDSDKRFLDRKKTCPGFKAVQGQNVLTKPNSSGGFGIKLKKKAATDHKTQQDVLRLTEHAKLDYSSFSSSSDDDVLQDKHAEKDTEAMGLSGLLSKDKGSVSGQEKGVTKQEKEEDKEVGSFDSRSSSSSSSSSEEDDDDDDDVVESSVEEIGEQCGSRENYINEPSCEKCWEPGENEISHSESIDFATRISILEDGSRSNMQAIQIYQQGQHERAIHEFKWAAEQCQNTAAFFNLGICMEEKSDFIMANQYYRIAAEKGHKQADFNIACLVLKNPKLFSKLYSEEDGIAYLKKAADLGLKQAQTEYGVALMEKKENKEMAEEAVRYFEFASQQGCPRAMYNLGICYERELGVSRDLVHAAELYELASSAEHSEAQHNLGVFHEHGLGGLEKNKQQALEWFQRAIQNGHQQSSFDVERLKRIDNIADGITAVAEYVSNDPLVTKDHKVLVILKESVFGVDSDSPSLELEEAEVQEAITP